MPIAVEVVALVSVEHKMHVHSRIHTNDMTSVCHDSRILLHNMAVSYLMTVVVFLYFSGS